MIWLSITDHHSVLVEMVFYYSTKNMIGLYCSACTNYLFSTFYPLTNLFVKINYVLCGYRTSLL